MQGFNENCFSLEKRVRLYRLFIYPLPFPSLRDFYAPCDSTKGRSKGFDTGRGLRGEVINSNKGQLFLV
jgi:hypothetical protein